MKKNITRLLCVVLLFAPKFLFAQQDITGLWKGQIYDDTTQKHIPYEIAISVDDGKLDGYSYATTKDSTGKDQIGMRSIKLKQKGDKIEIEDVDIVASTYSTAPSKRVRKHMNLVLEVKDSVLVMNGNWSTNWANNNKLHPVTGTVTLKRKNDGWQGEPLIKKLTAMHLSQNLSFVQSERRQETAGNNIGNDAKNLGSEQTAAEPLVVVPPAAEAATRKTSVIQSIYFKSDSLMFTLYDNGVVDGDTVSILAGNQLLFSRQGLSEKPATKVFYTKDITDSLMLTLYAENLGSIPPNTGVVIIYDGTKRYEVFYSADLSNNAAIMLRRYKGENTGSPQTGQ